MVLQHAVGKGNQFLRRAVDLSQKPALQHTGKCDNINMRHQSKIILGDARLNGADFRADLPDRAVNNRMNI